MKPPNTEHRFTADPSEPPHHEARRTLARLERISRLFDDALRIPGTDIRFGWDVVLGLIPVGGDALSTGITAYYMWEAHRLGARKRVLLTMLANSGVDFLVGAVPVVGDLADVAWRSNRKNMRVLLNELHRLGKLPPGVAPESLRRTESRRSRRSGWLPTLSPFRPLIMP